jgi:phage-related protein
MLGISRQHLARRLVPEYAKIRIHSGREHRVLYVAKFEEGVYVLHGFEKKIQKNGQSRPRTNRFTPA